MFLYPNSSPMMAIQIPYATHASVALHHECCLAATAGLFCGPGPVTIRGGNGGFNWFQHFFKLGVLCYWWCFMVAYHWWWFGDFSNGLTLKHGKFSIRNVFRFEHIWGCNGDPWDGQKEATRMEIEKSVKKGCFTVLTERGFNRQTHCNFNQW